MVFRSHDETRVIWLFVPAGLLDAQALAVFDDAEASITQPMCFDDGALAVRIISAYQAVQTDRAEDPRRTWFAPSIRCADGGNR